MVAGLALVMLLAALNLSGVFEVGASLQTRLARRAAPTLAALWGSAFTGALAVVVAAPCTAPFMAPALGFALTQGPAVALAIFVGLGLGLAAPFTALAFAPGAAQAAARPGAWMETFKGVLAFPMYGAAAWLVWVFSQQAGTLGLAALMAAAVLTGFAAWLYGAAQRAADRRRQALGPVRRGRRSPSPAPPSWPSGRKPAPPAAGAAAASAGGLPTEPIRRPPRWRSSAAGQAGVRRLHRRLVRHLPGQRADGAVQPARSPTPSHKAGAVYMVADWTNRDAAIAKALAAHGRAGVPLYLMYGKAGGEPVVLPQILTPGIVVDAVKKAAA